MCDSLQLVNTEFYRARRVDTAGFAALFSQTRITSVSDDRTHGAKVAIQSVKAASCATPLGCSAFGVGSRTMREHLPIKKRRTFMFDRESI